MLAAVPVNVMPENDATPFEAVAVFVACVIVIAVAVLHDEDRNGQMKTNFIGIPQEGWAASNNAEAQTFGPPRFDDAKLSATDDLRQVLSVNY